MAPYDRCGRGGGSSHLAGPLRVPSASGWLTACTCPSRSTRPRRSSSRSGTGGYHRCRSTWSSRAATSRGVRRGRPRVASRPPCRRESYLAGRPMGAHGTPAADVAANPYGARAFQFWCWATLAWDSAPVGRPVLAFSRALEVDLAGYDTLIVRLAAAPHVRLSVRVDIDGRGKDADRAAARHGRGVRVRGAARGEDTLPPVDHPRERAPARRGGVAGMGGGRRRQPARGLARPILSPRRGKGSSCRPTPPSTSRRCSPSSSTRESWMRSVPARSRRSTARSWIS